MRVSIPRRRIAWCLAVMVLALLLVAPRGMAQDAPDPAGDTTLVATMTRVVAQGLADVLGTLPDEPARVAALRAFVRNVRFLQDQSGYFWVYRGHVCVSNPAFPELEGRDQGDLTDAAGAHIMRDMAELAAAGGGFYSYRWKKPAQDGPALAKLASVAPLPGTEYWIGTGVYLAGD